MRCRSAGAFAERKSLLSSAETWKMRAEAFRGPERLTGGVPQENELL